MIPPILPIDPLARAEEGMNTLTAAAWAQACVTAVAQPHAARRVPRSAIEAAHVQTDALYLANAWRALVVLQMMRGPRGPWPWLWTWQ